MENIRLQAKNCAESLLPRANRAATVELFTECIDMVVDLAISLGCNKARNTGNPGYGILFEATGQSNPGKFSFFATRPKMDDGVVAISISDDAVAQRAPELRNLVRDLCRQHGVAVDVDSNNKWPAIGFTSVAAGKQIIQAISSFLLKQSPLEKPVAESTADPYVLTTIRARRGQPAFRQLLLEAYDGRCVITGCSVSEALEAAHIIPHSDDGEYSAANGLLMRADIHTLFDLHLLTICPDKMVVILNPRLRPSYGQFESQAIRAPSSQTDIPDREGLTRHWTVWQTLL